MIFMHSSIRKRREAKIQDQADEKKASTVAASVDRNFLVPNIVQTEHQRIYNLNFLQAPSFSASSSCYSDLLIFFIYSSFISALAVLCAQHSHISFV